MTIIVEPSRPCFFAIMSADMTGITSFATTLVQFDTENVDVGSYYDPSSTNYKWTPPAGRVFLGARLRMTGSTATGNYTQIFLYKNGSAWLSQAMGASNNMGWPQIYGEDIANGSDYYQVYGSYQLSSGTATFRSTSTDSQFYGYWIGP